MVPVEGVIVIGSHGLEASFENDLLPGVDRVALSGALEQVEQRVISLAPSSFLHIERKAISTAFHFRRAPELESALRQALESLPEGLRLPPPVPALVFDRSRDALGSEAIHDLADASFFVVPRRTDLGEIVV